MITDLPFIDKTFRDLYKKYIKNNDVAGLTMLISVFTSSTLNHLIYQLEYILDNKIVDDNLGYIRLFIKRNKEYLELI